MIKNCKYPSRCNNSIIDYNMVMKKSFITFLIFVLSGLCGANAYQIVYPKKLNVTINSPSTFFIGHTDDGEILKINDEIIKTNDLGYFAHTVELKSGKNTFEVIGEQKKETYTILRTAATQAPLKPEFIAYDSIRYGVVKSDNTPLRSTPIDAGINRLSHLQKGVNLMIAGEYKNFYKVKLTDQEYAWINKISVIFPEDIDTDLSTVFDYRKYEDNEFDIYEFYLMKKVPYKIEESPLKLTIFNLKNSRGLFTIQPTLCHKPVGFNGEYEGDKFVLKVRKFPKISSIKPLEKVKIVIDPGHGGSEPGAIGCSGIAEKDIVMQISKYLQRELKHMGATVILTREDDSYLDLYDRVKFTNDNDAIIFISIHANATPDSWNPNEHSGTSVYYYYEQAKPLAESILLSTVEKAETNNDGIYQRSFAVVRNTKALSVLVETAYMINPDDIAKLEQTYFQKNIAKGISQGIVNFFKTSVLP